LGYLGKPTLAQAIILQYPGKALSAPYHYPDYSKG
jgi:hypothetical protein